MNFGNNSYTNNQETRNVNTKIRTFYSDLSSIQLSYWNESISIKINPIINVTPEGQRQYDFSRRISTAISTMNCIALREKMEKTIIPAIKKVADGEELDEEIKNIGVIMETSHNGLYFDYKKDAEGKPAVYMTLYTNVDQGTNVAPKETTYTYKFNKAVVNEGYNDETGEIEKQTEIEAEFLFVYDKIRNIAELAGSVAHAMRTERSYKNNNQHNNQTFTVANNNNNSFGMNPPMANPPEFINDTVTSFDPSSFPMN